MANWPNITKKITDSPSCSSFSPQHQLFVSPPEPCVSLSVPLQPGLWLRFPQFWPACLVFPDLFLNHWHGRLWSCKQFFLFKRHPAGSGRLPPSVFRVSQLAPCEPCSRYELRRRRRRQVCKSHIFCILFRKAPTEHYGVCFIDEPSSVSLK